MIQNGVTVNGFFEDNGERVNITRMSIKGNFIFFSIPGKNSEAEQQTFGGEDRYIVCSGIVRGDEMSGTWSLESEKLNFSFSKAIWSASRVTSNEEKNVPLNIPEGTDFLVELLQVAGTNISNNSDEIQVRILEPKGFANTIIIGRAYRIPSVRTDGRVGLLLAFDNGTLVPSGNISDRHYFAFHGRVIKVNGVNGINIDKEGSIFSKDKNKEVFINKGTRLTLRSDVLPSQPRR